MSVSSVSSYHEAPRLSEVEVSQKPLIKDSGFKTDVINRETTSLPIIKKINGAIKEWKDVIHDRTADSRKKLNDCSASLSDPKKLALKDNYEEDRKATEAQRFPLSNFP